MDCKVTKNFNHGKKNHACVRWRRFHALKRGFGVFFCNVFHITLVMLVATSSAQLKPGERCCLKGSVRKILLLLFTFLLLQKSNKKGDPKSIYSPLSGSALLNFSNSVVSTFVILRLHPEFSAAAAWALTSGELNTTELTKYGKENCLA